MRVPARLQALVDRLTPAQKQWAMLGFLTVSAVGILWTVLAATEKPRPPAAANGTPSRVTNLGVMPGGAQVSPLDQWVGTAGKRLAQYESDRAHQEQLNDDDKAFQAKTQERFAALEQQLRSQPAPSPQSAGTSPATPPPLGYPPANALPLPQNLPPPPPPPLGRSTPVNTLPPGTPGALALGDPTSGPGLVRISLSDHTKVADQPPQEAKDAQANSVTSFLPVSFTRGILLGGLDAPTGGQSQSNPQPVLIRLEDNAILPNQFRSNVRECFVIAAGYGDISSERAYLRTENLSCVRHDGSTLEVKIQGSVYGEDGKVGMRGRLVTKQGQILANALAAGVVSGIGQGFALRESTVSTSSFGTVATTDGSQAFQQGIGNGVGRALDRLAQYYIKLAEQTFPVIEVDAGRQVDVVITKGVNLGAPTGAHPTATSPSDDAAAHELRAARNED